MTSSEGKPALGRRLWNAVPWNARNGLALQSAQLVGRVPSRTLRTSYYRWSGVDLGDRVVIHRGLELRKPEGIKIGDGTVVGFDCILDGRGGLELGQNVNLSSEVAIWTMQHDLRDPDFGVVSRRAVVEDRAWLSFRCTILPGVTVGEGAVIAAGAVVVKDVPPYAVMAGLPAAQVGERPRDLRYEFPGRAAWFV
jgi:acetyltransferase-like isoleucine patch superfamily enzyme